MAPDGSAAVGLTNRTETSTDGALTVRIRNAVEHAWTALLDGQTCRADMLWSEAGGDA
jgi:hypothetical protein